MRLALQLIICITYGFFSFCSLQINWRRPQKHPNLLSNECLLHRWRGKVLSWRYMWGFHATNECKSWSGTEGLWGLTRVDKRSSSQLWGKCKIMHQPWNFTALGPNLQNLWLNLGDWSGACGMCALGSMSCWKISFPGMKPFQSKLTQRMQLEWNPQIRSWFQKFV